MQVTVERRREHDGTGPLYKAGEVTESGHDEAGVRWFKNTHADGTYHEMHGPFCAVVHTYQRSVTRLHDLSPGDIIYVTHSVLTSENGWDRYGWIASSRRHGDFESLGDLQKYATILRDRHGRLVPAEKHKYYAQARSDYDWMMSR